MRTVSIVIPVLNEEASIAYVLTAIAQVDDLGAQIDEIIVVDGGSTDRTAKIASDLGARIIHEPRRGYGRACAVGLGAARADFIVFLDGDGADDPEQLPRLVKPLVNGEADLVLGSRLNRELEPGAMPWLQRIGNWFAGRLVYRLYGVNLTDLSPFRSARRDALLSLELREMTYGWPTEMIVKAIRNNWRVLEIAVPYRRRHGGQSKIGSTLRGSVLSGYFILITIFRYIFWPSAR